MYRRPPLTLGMPNHRPSHVPLTGFSNSFESRAYELRDAEALLSR